jgi:uncharacterized surface protein with fasciclin (FAS1) repeats
MKRLLVIACIVALAATGSAAARTKEEGNVVQTAVAAGQFKTLAKLLGRAGLVNALQQPGPFTVFAPTDAAFKKVPKETLTALLHNRRLLKKVLLYHVVVGKVSSSQLSSMTSAKTLNGKNIRVRVSGMNVFVNTAKVTAANVSASNGVIHIINRVLIPPR